LVTEAFSVIQMDQGHLQRACWTECTAILPTDSTFYNGDEYDDDDDDDNFYSAITRHMPLQGRLDKIHVTCQRYDFTK